MIRMGLFTAYAIYKHGQRKERKQFLSEAKRMNEKCVNCGYARYQHSDDKEKLCPVY